MHQLLEADIVYARDIGRPEEMTDEQMRHLALIAHCVDGSSDLAYRRLRVLAERGAAAPTAPAQYLARAHGPTPGGA
jgi:hypothetical protein